MKKRRKTKPKLSPAERFKKQQLNFVVSALRRRSIVWPPRIAVLNRSYAGQYISQISGRKCKHYRCELCSIVVPLKLMNMDHIRPIGRKDNTWKWIPKLLSPE